MSTRSETMYDADSSVEARAAKKRASEKGEAKKGDTRTFNGEEYESEGTSADPDFDADAPVTDLATTTGNRGKNGKGSLEYWRRKKKPEPESEDPAVPTS